MKTLIKYCVILALVCCTKQSNSQNRSVDSLKSLLKTAESDTVRLQLKFAIGDAASIFRIGYWDSLYAEAKKINSKSLQASSLNNIGYVHDNLGDFQNALKYYTMSLKITEEIGDKKNLAGSLHNIGSLFKGQGDIRGALEYYERSLKIWEEIGDKHGLAASLNNIGNIYDNQGDIPKALDYYGKSLKIREENNDKRGVGSSLHNIGFVYSNQGDIPKALDYFSRSLKIREEIGDKEGVAYSLNSIGLIYNNQGDILSAVKYYIRSLKIREEIGDKKGIGVSLNNIGIIYRSQGDIPKALDYFGKSLKIRKEIHEKEGVATSFNNIAAAYFKLVFTTKAPDRRRQILRLAFSYSDSSLTLSKELGFPAKIRNAELNLSKIDSALGNYATAFEHYKQFVIYRDSISNQETRKAGIKSQLKYEYEKKEAVMKEQQKKDQALSAEKNRRQQIIIWSVAAGLLLVIGFAGFVFRSLKVTREQKLIIEEKQKDILDSIRYAKRIQQSLLPNEKYFDKNLKRLCSN